MNFNPAIKLLLLFALLSPTVGIGQSKIPVYVFSRVDEKDSNGSMLIFELKDAIRGANSYRLVGKTKDWPYIKIVIVSVPTRAGGIAYSVSILYDNSDMLFVGALISYGVETCPAASISSCARGVLPSLEHAVDTLKKLQPRLYKALQAAPSSD